MGGATSPSRIRNTLPQRRRTRTYDVSNFEPLIEYLEEYLTPVGSIISKLTPNSPGEAWVLVQGQSLSKADYPELCDELAGIFGETDTTFNLPDLSNTYLTGAGDTDAGQQVGSNQVTISEQNMPLHNHAITDPGHTHGFTDPGHTHTVTDPGHSHTQDVASSEEVMSGAGATVADYFPGAQTSTEQSGVAVDSAETGGSVDQEVTGISLADAGSGSPLGIRPKSIAVHYFIKARS